MISTNYSQNNKLAFGYGLKNGKMLHPTDEMVAMESLTRAVQDGKYKFRSDAFRPLMIFAPKEKNCGKPLVGINFEESEGIQQIIQIKKPGKNGDLLTIFSDWKEPERQVIQFDKVISSLRKLLPQKEERL